MSNNLEQKVLLVGTGNMGKEYAKVLDALHVSYDVIGRSEGKAKEFEEITGHLSYFGGLENYLSSCQTKYKAAIIAVQDYLECDCAEMLLQYGVKKILAEKPLGLDIESLKKIRELALEAHADIYIAYNRRFYASTLAAEKIIREDGGITSFHFEFTELHCESVERAQNWLVSNSSHVMDLAFFLGGKPTEIKAFANQICGEKEKIAFTGAGRCKNDVLFSYCANYRAPGRWGLEIMTEKSRLIFKPMEKLQRQERGKFSIEEIAIDNELDLKFKPGLYRQMEDFLKIQPTYKLKTIDGQIESVCLYYNILKGC